MPPLHQSFQTRVDYFDELPNVVIRCLDELIWQVTIKVHNPCLVAENGLE